MNARFPIILFFVEAFYYLSRLRSKPVITLFFIGAMILFHINKNMLGIYSNVSRACISYNYIWWNKQYGRLWWHSLVHLSDWHLYYNMVNLLWKGGTLEPLLGWLHYLVSICIIIPLCAIVYIALAFALFIFKGSYYGETYLFQCAAGFSGVLFALRVIELSVIHRDSSYSIFGIEISLPKHCIVWIELVVIYLIEPNSSFIGHFSGIVVGLMYTLGPLNWFINGVCQTNISANSSWISFLSFYRHRSSRPSERETPLNEPYMYPFRTENHDSGSYLNFSQQELMRNRILNATEKRLAKSRGRR